MRKRTLRRRSGRFRVVTKRADRRRSYKRGSRRRKVRRRRRMRGGEGGGENGDDTKTWYNPFEFYRDIALARLGLTLRDPSDT